MAKLLSTWRTATVGDVVLRHFSGPSPTCEERTVRLAEEWGLLKTTAVSWEGWQPDAHKVPPRKYWGDRSIEVHAGDVLVTKAGPRHRVGVVVFVRVTQPQLMVSGKMVGLRPDPSVILPQLLSGILSTRGPQQHLERVKTGMAESQLNFSNSMLLGTPLVFPPDLSEQRHVAAILDTVDEAIRQTEAVVEKLKKIKQGLLHDLLTRGIGKDGKLRPPPAQAPHLYKGSPLGKIPNEWEVKEIKRMSTLITKGTTPTTYGFDYAKEGVAFLRVENISNEGSIDVQGCLHITVACQEFMRRSQLKEADVLISIAGTIGRSACVPATTLPANINQALAIVRCEESQLLPPFLSYYLSSQLGRSAMLGQTVQLAQANLSLTEVGRTLVAMPATPEQRSIVSALQAHGERTDADSKTCEKLKLIKQGLKEDLLTGRVRVTDLPKDIEKMLDEIAGRN